MKVEIDSHCAVFHEGGREAGRLILDDPFKPYLHPLLSPAGHAVTVASPGDHRHHKGMMYALRCADLNFWEENPDSGSCGVQEILQYEAVEGEGLRLDLLWREQEGGLETYREEREIRCRHLPDKNAFLWQWQTRREALRDHRLIKSEWSLELPDGRKINYHGLGIRLPWVWAFKGFHGLKAEGQPATAEAVCGSIVPEVSWWGRIDGQWHAPCASVAIRQLQAFTWFAIDGDFPYLSIGPSNAAEQEIRAGQSFSERYEIEIADAISQAG